MNVLLVIWGLGGGGAERVMTWLADRLIGAGDSVCLVTQRDTSSDFYPLNPAVRRVAVGRGRYLDIPKVRGVLNVWRWRHALRTTARRERPDVVLSFIDATNMSVLAALAGTRLPVVVSERIDPRYTAMGFVARALRPYLYRHLARQVVVQTEVIAARVRRDWRVQPVAVIPNAVLMETPFALPGVSRRRRVLSVGRLARQKGHDLLIDAWARVSVAFPQWDLRIVGEGPSRSVLEAQVTRLGLANSVALPGLSGDMAAEYGAASIFALPSRFEGFPNALLEAMAFGCAPIATETAGASAEVIKSGVNGELIPGDDVGALAQALERLMGDEALRDRYGAQATAVAAEYAPDRIFQLWRDVLANSAGLE